MNPRLALFRPTNIDRTLKPGEIPHARMERQKTVLDQVTGGQQKRHSCMRAFSGEER